MSDEAAGVAAESQDAAAAAPAVASRAAVSGADSVDALKADLARRVQQPLSKLTFLEPLPPELLRNICETFDEAGTKEGQLLKRLEAYARSIARRNHLKLEPPTLPEGYGRYGSFEAVERRVEAFVHDLDMDGDILELLQCLEPAVQIEAVEQFDVQGTRDGNVKSRFFSFIRSVWLRHLRVNKEVCDFLRDFPEEMQADVMKNFDPSGTKDGNVSARLQSFATRRWRHSHRPKKHFDHNLDTFVRNWGLEAWASEVLWALPSEVQEEVLEGFDVSSTRDGNVSSRFLGYVRSRWATYWDLDQECCYAIKRLPRHRQIMCLTQFDPRATRDGNVSARMKNFLWKIDGQPNEGHEERYSDWTGGRGYQDYDGWRSNDWGPWSDDTHGYSSYSNRKADPGMRDAILKFVRRWDLDLAVGAYLEKLKDPDVLARVLEEFDPSGTQDGNVLFRLKSFVRLLCSRRKRGDLDDLDGDEGYQEPEAPTRARKEKWQKKPGS